MFMYSNILYSCYPSCFFFLQAELVATVKLRELHNNTCARAEKNSVRAGRRRNKHTMSLAAIADWWEYWSKISDCSFLIQHFYNEIPKSSCKVKSCYLNLYVNFYVFSCIVHNIYVSIQDFFFILLLYILFYN